MKLLVALLLLPLLSSAQRWVKRTNGDTMGTTIYQTSEPKQEHTVRVYLDSLGFTREVTFKAEFNDFICSQCKRKASIWIDRKWYCKRHYKKLKQ